MIINGPSTVTTRRRAAAYTLTEVIVALLALGLVAGAVLTGISSGMFAVQLTREDSRATQIMVEKIETIRLYNWDQVSSNGFIPTTFTAPYDPNVTASGLVYTGTFTIAPAMLNVSYSNDLLSMTVDISWASGNVRRQRQMSTYFSRYGLQDYIY